MALLLVRRLQRSDGCPSHRDYAGARARHWLLAGLQPCDGALRRLHADDCDVSDRGHQEHGDARGVAVVRGIRESPGGGLPAAGRDCRRRVVRPIEEEHRMTRCEKGARWLLVLLFSLCAIPLHADEVHVMVSGAFTAPYKVLVAEWEKSTGHTVTTA